MTFDKIQNWIDYLTKLRFTHIETMCNVDREILLTVRKNKHCFEILFEQDSISINWYRNYFISKVASAIFQNENDAFVYIKKISNLTSDDDMKRN